LIHPQRGKNSDDRYTDQCTDDCERNGDQNACQLRGKQAEVAEDESVPAGGIVDGTLSKQTGGDASPDSADAMAAKGIQRVIDFQLLFDDGNAAVADRADQETDDKRSPDGNEPGPRCDCHETNHKSCGSADQRWTAVFDHI